VVTEQNPIFEKYKTIVVLEFSRTRIGIFMRMILKFVLVHVQFVLESLFGLAEAESGVYIGTLLIPDFR